jgi:hypothetical protein
VDFAYAGGQLHVDGRDEDGAGLFDWIDVNRDGDTNDIVSIDEGICSYSGTIYDDDLRAVLSQLSPAKTTIVAEQCFSGGLVEDLSSTNRVICTATIEDAVSYGNIFIRGFVAALHGQNEYGYPVDADTDGNGAVSMLEAFNYAAANDYYDEIPQYDDSGDGIPHTDPVPAAGDGTFGASTYLCPPPICTLTGMSLSNGVVRFVLNGNVASSYVVQVSSNLVSWLPFSTNSIPVGGWVLIADQNPPLHPRRFYRAVRQ